MGWQSRLPSAVAVSSGQCTRFVGVLAGSAAAPIWARHILHCWAWLDCGLLHMVQVAFGRVIGGDHVNCTWKAVRGYIYR